MSEFLEQPESRRLIRKIVDNSPPTKDSTEYIQYFTYFEIDPKDKTIAELVLELNSRLEDRYNCKKTIFGGSYGFSEFRFTPEYRNYLELSQYFLSLSCWLYRDQKFPDELWKALDKGVKIYD